MYSGSATNEAPKKEWKLEKEQELRLEIEAGSKGKGYVTLKEGFAEIFGSELALGVKYAFSGCKIAVFTWQGCTLETSGDFSVEYVGVETPMNSFMNVHLALEALRDQALKSAKIAPRVLIVGHSCTGKTALAKILVNYAAKLSRRVTFVDIDPNQGSVAIPGSIGAMVLARPLECEEEFGASTTMMGTTPVVYYYGHLSPFEKPRLYTALANQLASIVNKKLDKDNLIASAGLVIDSPSQFAETGGNELLMNVVDAFKVNAILVIGHERMYSDLKRQYADNSGVTVLKLNKSGGVVSRDKNTTRQEQMQKVKEYFHGSIKNELTPFSQTVSFSDVVVRRVGEGTMAPSSALPLGMERKAMETKFMKVEPGDILLHSILAVSHALLPGCTDHEGKTVKIYTSEEEAAALLSSNVAGFIYVSEVSGDKRKMTILTPTPGKLPQTFLLMGTMKWMDT